MAIRFFRKLIPSNPVPTRFGDIKFDTLDGHVGFFATDSDDIAQDFVAHMHAQRCGISEVSDVEFHRDYTEKKTNSTPSTESWREEIVGGRLKLSKDPLAQAASGGAVAVAVKGSDIRPKGGAGATIAAPPTAEPQKQEWTQRTGKRPKTPKA